MKESAILPFTHAWAHRSPWLPSVAMIHKGERECHSFFPESPAQFCFQWHHHDSWSFLLCHSAATHLCFERIHNLKSLLFTFYLELILYPTVEVLHSYKQFDPVCPSDCHRKQNASHSFSLVPHSVHVYQENIQDGIQDDQDGLAVLDWQEVQERPQHSRLNQVRDLLHCPPTGVVGDGPYSLFLGLIFSLWQNKYAQTSKLANNL